MDAGYAPTLFGKARALCNAKRFGPAKATIDLYFQHSHGTDDLQDAANVLVALCRDAGVE